MERAKELIRPYVEREDVIGAYLVGSASRPFRDERSDYDIEVVLTDEAYAQTPDEARHVLVMDEATPSKVDHEFYLRPLSELEALTASRQDVVRYGYQHAVVLHDPHGTIAKALKTLGDLPGLWRHERLRVHWLELLFAVGRARVTSERGPDHALDVRMVLAEALRATVDLLFVSCGSWPASRHWTTDELYLLGVPESLLATLQEAAGTADLAAWRTLVDEVSAFLTSERHTFHEDREALIRWAYLTEDGKTAFERWA
jgi:hypothetical protein